MTHDPTPSPEPPRDGAASCVVTVNGAPRELPAGATVATLLAAAGLRSELVAVEVNRALVPRRAHAAHRLAAGDRVELVTLVGGG